MTRDPSRAHGIRLHPDEVLIERIELARDILRKAAADHPPAEVRPHLLAAVGTLGEALGRARQAWHAD
jgi:hypothetical protein